VGWGGEKEEEGGDDGIEGEEEKIGWGDDG